MTRLIITIGLFALFFNFVIPSECLALPDGRVSFSEPDLDESMVRPKTDLLLRLISGGFGLYAMLGSGLLAIFCSLTKHYRWAVALLMVAIGAFALRVLLAVSHGEGFERYLIGVPQKETTKPTTQPKKKAIPKKTDGKKRVKQKRPEQLRSF